VVVPAEARIGEIIMRLDVRLWPLVTPHLAVPASLCHRYIPTIVGAIGGRVALAIPNEAVIAIPAALLCVARLVAFAVAQPGVIATRLAAIGYILAYLHEAAVWIGT